MNEHFCTECGIIGSMLCYYRTHTKKIYMCETCLNKFKISWLLEKINGAPVNCESLFFDWYTIIKDRKNSLYSDSFISWIGEYK